MRRLVKMSTNILFTDPANGTDPTANSSYSGSGEQVIYNGSGNSVTVTGLKPATDYCFRIYEANCTGTSSVYNISSTSFNPFCVKTLDCSNPSKPSSITGSTSVCEGTAQLYYITPVTGAISYTWTLPNGWRGTSSSTSIIPTVGPSGGTISVTANNACGSSDPSRINISVVRAVTPSVSISVSPSSNSCLGRSLTFTASPTNGGSNPSYEWHLGSSVVGINNPIYSTSSLTNGQIVSCKMTSSTACVTSSTATSNPITISIPASPAVPVAKDASTITSTSFKANWNSVNGATYYKIDVATDAAFSKILTAYNNMDLGNATSYSITGLSCNTQYYYRVRASNSCDVLSSNSNSIPVKTGVCCSTPVTPVISPSGSILLCQGQTSRLNVSNVCTSCNYTWSNGQTGTTINVNSTGSYSVTAKNSCGSAVSTATSVSITDTVKILGQPSDQTVAINNSVTFTVNATGSNLSYQWQYFDGAVWEAANTSKYSGSKTAVLTVNSASAGMDGTRYRCVVSNSCGSKISKEANLAVNCPKPKDLTITSSAGKFNFCGTANLTLTASISNCNNSCGFQWNDGTAGKDLIINNLTATKTFEVTATNACGSTTGSKTITINPAPVVSVSATPNPVCQNAVLTLTANGAGSYTWKGDNLSASTGASVTANPATAGDHTYSVVGTQNGCTNTSNVTVSVTATGTGSCVFTSVPNLSDVQEFSVQPNPNPGVFNVRLKLSSMRDVQFTVLNMLGQEVYSSQVYHYSGAVDKQVVLPVLANGLYEMQTRIGKEKLVTKIIVNK